MQFKIDYKPAHTLATATLSEGETLRAEASAMVSMSSNIQVKTEFGGGKKKGGLFKGLKRAVLGGESFFTNTFCTNSGGGEVSLAPNLCGDMVVHELDGAQELFIQGSSYVASDDRVDVDSKFQGMKGLFSGESLFFLKASGAGPVLINAFGAIDTIDLDGEVIVDTGHLVAYSSGIEYTVSKASKGLIASFLSGEGLVLKMSGKGRIYIQTRNPSEYGKNVGGRLAPKEN